MRESVGQYWFYMWTPDAACVYVHKHLLSLMHLLTKCAYMYMTVNLSLYDFTGLYDFNKLCCILKNYQAEKKTEGSAGRPQNDLHFGSFRLKPQLCVGVVDRGQPWCCITEMIIHGKSSDVCWLTFTVFKSINQGDKLVLTKSILASITYHSRITVCHHSVFNPKNLNSHG